MIDFTAGAAREAVAQRHAERREEQAAHLTRLHGFCILGPDVGDALPTDTLTFPPTSSPATHLECRCAHYWSPRWYPHVRRRQRCRNRTCALSNPCRCSRRAPTLSSCAIAVNLKGISELSRHLPQATPDR